MTNKEKFVEIFGKGVLDNGEDFVNLNPESSICDIISCTFRENCEGCPFDSEIGDWWEDEYKEEYK